MRNAIGDEVGSAWTHKNRAQALLLVGDVDGALRDASTARSIGRSAGLERLEHQASLVLARVELAPEASEEGARSVDVQINRLRQKIEEDPSNPVHLQTVRGAGYVLHAS